MRFQMWCLRSKYFPKLIVLQARIEFHITEKEFRVSRKAIAANDFNQISIRFAQFRVHWLAVVSFGTFDCSYINHEISSETQISPIIKWQRKIITSDHIFDRTMRQPTLNWEERRDEVRVVWWMRLGMRRKGKELREAKENCSKTLKY